MLREPKLHAPRLSLWRRWLLCLLLGLSGLAWAAPVDLNQHWQYRWGDSPFNAKGQPLWLLEPDSPEWKPIAFPSNPPGRNKQENLWFRSILPEGDWRDPVLYIYSVDLITEVYVEGRRIYHYGTFDAQGKGRFIGWPWHMIDLPADSAGKPIYFRIFSNYMDIGLWGEVMVMERMDLYAKILKHSADDLLIAIFSLLIALLTLLFAATKSTRFSLIGLALFALSNAGMALGASQAKQLLLNWPLLWDYLSAASYFLLPVAMALLLQGWSEPSQQQRLRAIRWFFLLYLLVALGLSALGLTTVAHSYPPFDLLFALALPLMLGPALWQLKNLDANQRAIVFACVLLSLLLLLDMAVAHSLLPWGRIPVAWGVLLFALAIIGISLRQYIATHEAVVRLNTTLEARVAERTAELQQMAQRETARAKALELSQAKALQIGRLLTELEQQGDVETALTHLLAQLPGLCPHLPAALYLADTEQDGFILQRSWGTTELPDRLDRQPRLPGWRSYIIDYDHPRQGRLEAALFTIDFSRLDDPEAELDAISLNHLFEQGMERINLSLSRLCLNQELSQLSYEDALTGMHNRRYLDEMLPREIQLAQRNQTPLSVLICDLDHFKQFNDRHGHVAGDEALKTLATRLHDSVRQTDMLCRYGGEEFVVIMPTADADECRQRAEQLRQQVAATQVRFQGRDLDHLSLSVGTCTWPDQCDDPEHLLQRADSALYQAKQRGRNRVFSCNDNDRQQAQGAPGSEC